MVMAAELSARMGWLAAADVPMVRELLLAAGLPVDPPAGLGEEQFLGLMAADKKVAAGKLRLVLLRAPGEATVTADFPFELLRGLLADFLRRPAA